MYNLEYEMSAHLPRLAWCARVGSHGKVVVRHGPWVEAHEQSFFEGAWAGKFESFDFPDSVVCLGSGARISNDGIVFAAPSHTLENLYLLRGSDEILVSNSLAFVLVEAGDCYRLDYPLYQQDLVSIVDGLDKYIRKLPTKNGNHVELYYHCNLHIDGDLTITEQQKAPPDEFGDYEHYVDFLRNSVAAVAQNAADPVRHQHYRPLTTISSGYDSTAAAVLAVDVGCDEAITFADARGDFSDTDDSGSRIGRLLSLRVTEFDRTGFLSRQGCTEAEFLASGKGGQEVIMSIWDELLPGCLLFTGFHGDRVWGIHKAAPSPSIVRGDTSGGSLSEFRLRLGFIHLPVPFLGCVRYPSIHKISDSLEMKPWFIDQKGRHRRGYNRPIPRRIVEERGIPREWFGQTKKAAGQPSGFYPRETNLSNLPLSEVMSDDSLRDFNVFAETLEPRLKGLKGVHFALMRRLYVLNERMLWRLGPYPRLSRKPRDFLLKQWRYQNSLSRDGFLFHWGLMHVIQRYRAN